MSCPIVSASSRCSCRAWRGHPEVPQRGSRSDLLRIGISLRRGARFTFDLGQGGLFVGAGGGSVEPGWMIGGQFGLDYDEGVRRMRRRTRSRAEVVASTL